MNTGNGGMREGTQVERQFRCNGVHPLERYRAHIRVGGLYAIAGGDASNVSVFNGQAIHRRTPPDGYRGETAPRFRGIKLGQGNSRHSHLVGIAASEKAEREYLKAMARGHAVKLFVNGAYQNLTPESLNRLFGLLLLAQPGKHRDPV